MNRKHVFKSHSSGFTINTAGEKTSRSPVAFSTLWTAWSSQDETRNWRRNSGCINTARFRASEPPQIRSRKYMATTAEAFCT